MPDKASIVFTEQTVIKTGPQDRIRVEAEKTRQAFLVAKISGAFRVPAVLDYTEEKGVIVFERIHGLAPVRNTRTGALPTLRMVENVGRALAVVHRELDLSEDLKIVLPPEFSWPGAGVFLHGDFNGSNVCAAPGATVPVIIDWQMTSVHGGQATYGTRYFDILWFVNFLLWTPTARYLFHDPVMPLARSFLHAYFQEEGKGCVLEDLANYAKRFFESKAPCRKMNSHWRSRLLLFRSRLLTKRFIAFLMALPRGGASASDAMK